MGSTVPRPCLPQQVQAEEATQLPAWQGAPDFSSGLLLSEYCLRSQNQEESGQALVERELCGFGKPTEMAPRPGLQCGLVLMSLPPVRSHKVEESPVSPCPRLSLLMTLHMVFLT